jgi:hypothetical protein
VDYDGAVLRTSDDIGNPWITHSPARCLNQIRGLPVAVVGSEARTGPVEGAPGRRAVGLRQADGMPHEPNAEDYRRSPRPVGESGREAPDTESDARRATHNRSEP